MSGISRRQLLVCGFLLLLLGAACGGKIPPVGPGNDVSVGPGNVGPDSGAAPDTQVLIIRHLNHENPSHPEWQAAGGNVTHLEGTAYMQWDYIRLGDPDDPLDYHSDHARTSVKNSGADWPVSGVQRQSIMWFDLDQIPSNVKVIAADLCVSWHQSIASLGEITHRVTLDTMVSDEVWLTGNDTLGYGGSRQATWNAAIQPATGDSTPWAYTSLVAVQDDSSSDISDRHDSKGNQNFDPSKFGIPSPSIGPEAYSVLEHEQYDVKRAVQMYNKGLAPANAGWWFSGVRTSATDDIRWQCEREDWLTAPDTMSPFLRVEYISNQQHAYPWNGKQLALVLCTDDQSDINVDYIDTLDNYGEKHTIFVRNVLIGSGGYMTWDQIQTADSGGTEIGAHSLTHNGTGGVLYTTTGDVDTVVIECDHQWLTDSLLTRPVTFAFPGHVRNIATDSVLSRLGYWAARGGQEGQGVGNANAQYPVGNPSSGEDVQRVAWGDTFNIFAMAVATAIDSVSGGDATNPTQWDIKWDFFQTCVTEAFLDGNGLMILYWHDEKDAAPYSGGLDADELGMLMRVVNDHGGIEVMTMKEAAGLMRNNRVPTHPPPSATDSDSAGVTARDQIWWRPNREIFDTSILAAPVSDNYLTATQGGQQAGVGQQYDQDDDDSEDDFSEKATSATYDSLAAHDWYQMNAATLFRPKGDASVRSIGFIDSLRVRNPDMLIAVYVNWTGLLINFAGDAGQNTYAGKYWDAIVDNGGIMYSTAGAPDTMKRNDGQNYIPNFTVPAVRTAVAETLYNLWDNSYNRRGNIVWVFDYAEDFLPYAVMDNNVDTLDLDQDAVGHETDVSWGGAGTYDDEVDAWRHAHLIFNDYFRTLIPEDHYIIWNGGGAAENDITFWVEDFQPRLDGVYLEKFPQIWDQGHYGKAFKRALFAGPGAGVRGDVFTLSGRYGTGNWDSQLRLTPLLFMQNQYATSNVLNARIEVIGLLGDYWYSSNEDNGRTEKYLITPYITDGLGPPTADAVRVAGNDSIYRQFQNGFVEVTIDTTSAALDGAFYWNVETYSGDVLRQSATWPRK